ncbi:MAG: SHOCT domain-containing protein [Nocardioides sp.]|nr:SHOCT domain-containing protein [Nocardioides sp.]
MILPLEFSVWDVFLSMLYFTLFFLWIWLWIMIVADIFRSDDMGGWGKAGWIVLCIFLPFLGALLYLIIRGPSMTQRRTRDYQEMESRQQEYIRQVAGSGGGASASDEIEKLARLRDAGTITAAEFEAGKAKVLS